MTVNIAPKRGHWEVHINGKFFCSADTFNEAVKEYQDYVEERNVNEVKSSKQELQYC